MFLEAWNCLQAMNSLAHSEHFQAYICKSPSKIPFLIFQFNSFTGRMKMCLFMNEKFQLLGLVAEISRKPSHEECCLIADPSYFPLAQPIKCGGTGFPMGCSQERARTGKTKTIFLPGVGEKNTPQTVGTLVLSQFGSFKKTCMTSLRSVCHKHTKGSLQITQLLLNVEKIEA